MKNIPIYFAAILISILIINSCKSGVNTTDSNSIEFISYKTNGCVSTSKIGDLDRITDDADIETYYDNGILEVYIKFTTHCSAEMKDSLVIEANKIDIFLEDTNHDGSRCICPHKEEFKFTVNEGKEIKIKFNYNAYASDVFYTIADTTIFIK